MKSFKTLKRLLLVSIVIFLIWPSLIFAKDDILNKRERDLLESLSPLIIMVDDGFAPISYYDSDSNQFGGIAVEVIKQLSQSLDFEYSIIRDESLTWSDKINKIKSGEINVLGGVSYNKERTDYGYFNSLYYFSTNYSLIGNINNHILLQNIKDISKYNLGLVKNAAINPYLESLSASNNITYYNSMEEGLKALSLEEIDLVAENEAVFIEEYFNDKRFDFEILLPIYEAQKSYAFLFPKDEDHKLLATIFDKGMEEIDLDKIVIERYQNKSIFSYYKAYLDDLRVESFQKTIILVGLSLVIFAGLVFVIVMRIRNKELTQASETDYLTQLKNRAALFKDYGSSKDLENKLIYFIDLDDFKNVNDTYGHKVGDEVLLWVADSLKAIAPQADIYRMGGDEFILISSDKDVNIGQRILNKIKLPITYKDQFIQVYASVGYISTSKFKDLDLSQFINLADHAMLKVKASGKNNILEVLYDN